MSRPCRRVGGVIANQILRQFQIAGADILGKLPLFLDPDAAGQPARVNRDLRP